jgi:hypothetical protein
MYRIIGADGKEYGPISAEQLKLWIAEGRANAHTKVRLEGATDWKPLGELPEFALATPLNAPPGTVPGTIYAPMTTKTNSMAIAGLVMGILSLTMSCCCYGLPFNILGIIFSTIALSQIKKDPLTQTGRGLAIAGLICSILSIVVSVLLLVFWGVVGGTDMLRKLRQLQ